MSRHGIKTAALCRRSAGLWGLWQCRLGAWVGLFGEMRGGFWRDLFSAALIPDCFLVMVFFLFMCAESSSPLRAAHSGVVLGTGTSLAMRKRHPTRPKRPDFPRRRRRVFASLGHTLFPGTSASISRRAGHPVPAPKTHKWLHIPLPTAPKFAAHPSPRLCIAH